MTTTEIANDWFVAIRRREAARVAVARAKVELYELEQAFERSFAEELALKRKFEESSDRDRRSSCAFGVFS